MEHPEKGSVAVPNAERAGLLVLAPPPPRQANRKPILALVGPLGAGKSTAAECFARRGGAIIDGDALGHEALRQPAIRAAVIQRWGPGLVRPDGSLDRRALGRIVFADPAQRNALEQLVFPYIERRLREQIEQAQQDPRFRFVVVDAAVLLEAGWNQGVDRIVYVDAPASLRQARLIQRSGWTPAEIAGREAAQWPPERKRTAAHAILANQGDPQDLQRQVDRLLQTWGLLSDDGSGNTGREPANS
jgi:dephospho-CoA kinase